MRPRREHLKQHGGYYHRAPAAHESTPRESKREGGGEEGGGEERLAYVVPLQNWTFMVSVLALTGHGYQLELRSKSTREPCAGIIAREVGGARDGWHTSGNWRASYAATGQSPTNDGEENWGGWRWIVPLTGLADPVLRWGPPTSVCQLVMRSKSPSDPLPRRTP